MTQKHLFSCRRRSMQAYSVCHTVLPSSCLNVAGCPLSRLASDLNCSALLFPVFFLLVLGSLPDIFKFCLHEPIPCCTGCPNPTTTYDTFTSHGKCLHVFCCCGSSPWCLQSDLQFTRTLQSNQPFAKLIHLYVSEDQVKISRLPFCFFSRLSFGGMFALGLFREILCLRPHPSVLITWISLTRSVQPLVTLLLKIYVKWLHLQNFSWLPFVIIQIQLTQAAFLDHHVGVLPRFVLGFFLNYSLDICIVWLSPPLRICHVFSSTWIHKYSLK